MHVPPSATLKTNDQLAYFPLTRLMACCSIGLSGVQDVACVQKNQWVAHGSSICLRLTILTYKIGSSFHIVNTTAMHSRNDKRKDIELWFLTSRAIPVHPQFLCGLKTPIIFATNFKMQRFNISDVKWSLLYVFLSITLFWCSDSLFQFTYRKENQLFRLFLVTLVCFLWDIAYILAAVLATVPLFESCAGENN